MEYSYFCKGDSIGYDKANEIVTDAAIKYLTENETNLELDLSEVSIKDVAPTIVQLLGVEPDEEWECKPLLK